MIFRINIIKINLKALEVTIVNLLKSRIFKTQKITISEVENFNSCTKNSCRRLALFSELNTNLKVWYEKNKRKITNNNIKYVFVREERTVVENISDNLIATILKFFR